ncbi:MAG TPA: MFS transporter, partial [Candidatus Binataceae bacterium]|nr:MFS transporter [Candidatus Binataceae bacterium]
MPAATAPQSSEIFETLIPARLDRLPWSRFHWLLVIGLGITWVLDGLEITLMGAISAVLQRPDVLHFTAAQIGSISSAYLTGAVLGSLVFGHLTDRFGRRTFFFVTLAIYLAGVGLTALSWNLWSFALFRFITGAGIGGEYSAVNSAIDELIPARFRGRVDLIINGSFWLGAAVGSLSTLV